MSSIRSSGRPQRGPQRAYIRKRSSKKHEHIWQVTWWNHDTGKSRSQTFYDEAQAIHFQDERRKEHDEIMTRRREEKRKKRDEESSAARPQPRQKKKPRREVEEVSRGETDAVVVSEEEASRGEADALVVSEEADAADSSDCGSSSSSSSETPGSPQNRRSSAGRTTCGPNNKTEARAIRMLAPYLFNVFAVWDGARADLIFWSGVLKIGSRDQDMYKGIQIKSTMERQRSGAAKFKDTSGYSGMVVMCVLISERKVWLFRGEELEGKRSGISIGKDSCYNDRLVELEELQTRLEGMLMSYDAHPKAYWDTYGLPKTYLMEYVAHQQYCDKLNINTIKQLGDEENSIFDERIHGVRIQEKVASPKGSSHAFYASIKKYGGMDGRTQLSQPYSVNDGIDVFHIMVLRYGDDGFSHNHLDVDRIKNAKLIGYFAIPMSIMAEHGYVSTADSDGKQGIYCYLPDEVCEEESIPKPIGNPDLWTRRYFHRL